VRAVELRAVHAQACISHCAACGALRNGFEIVAPCLVDAFDNWAMG
jgi:hypothetical protein